MISPPAQGERSLTLEIVCRDNAKAWLVFDQINGELLDRGSITLEVAKPRRNTVSWRGTMLENLSRVSNEWRARR